MELLMCRSCGHFVRALPDDGTVAPIADECPDCGGAEFKHNESGRYIRVD